ncbi:MAG TPA: SDR family oxidoreductase [Thermoleophilaceae bacterium]|nr:SDR family oxidoreductase [Thermoleophilaceae bacterium]
MAGPRYDLNGKVVFVTGAARGIGAECARRTAARGARVVLAGLEPEELERVAAGCGPDATWFEVDVTDRESLQAAVDATVERFGGIDVLISNAGVAGGGPVRHVPAERIERIVEINLLGSMKTIRAVLPHVVERRGYVLQIASLAAAVHSPGMSGYSASKAGIEAYANCLRSEVKHLGVDVGVGYFSWIDTDLVKGADSQRSYRLLRSKLRGPFARTYPVSDVGDAVIEGIEARAPRVFVPGWASALVTLRPLVQWLTAKQGGDSMPEFDRLAQEELAKDPDRAGSPVGPGGEAASDSARRRATA